MADDIIASARSMTTYTDNQYNAVGFPKGGLTPATLTAMVGFAKGEGLQMNPMVSAALSKLQGVTSATIAGLPAGAASALGNANISLSTINSSSNVTATVAGIKDALAADGMMLDTATENSLTSSITASTKLASLSSKLMAGGPAELMSKMNIARAHIGDAIELKKMTAFTANQTLDKFGTGMKKMSSLSCNGLDGAMGNMKAAGEAMKAAGGLFDLKDMANFGSAAGLVKKLTDSKMANATGLNAKLAAAGVKASDITNPVYADKVNSVMNSINDPKILNAVADQCGVNPAAGLPTSPNNSLVGALGIASKANPFAALPSQPPADPNAAANLLSKSPAAPTAPPKDPAVKPEASTNPVVWGNKNDVTTFGKTVDSQQEKLDKIDQELQDMSTDFIATTDDFTNGCQELINAEYALDFAKQGVLAERKALADKFTAEHGFAQLQLAFDKANKIGLVTRTLPKSSPEYIKWATLRNGNIENILKLCDGQYKNLIDARKDIEAKVAKAGGS